MTRFVLFMFDYYICSVSSYCSVSSNEYIPENGHLLGIHNRQRFVLIPFVGCFDIIIVTDFPVYILSNTILPVCILIWDKNVAPWDEVVISLGACITESTPRVSPIMKNISLKISSEEAPILCGNNKPFSRRLKPGTSQSMMGVM